MQNAEILKEVIGLDEEVAIICCQKQGFPVRVVSEDGVGFIVTCDAIHNRVNRVNLDLIGGKVVNSHFG